MTLTAWVWAAIARMDQLDHSLQRDHRSPRQCHRLSERTMTVWALMFDWPIPAPHHVWIASASFHGLSPCLSRIPFSFPPILPYPPRRIFCPHGKKKGKEGKKGCHAAGIVN